MLRKEFATLTNFFFQNVIFRFFFTFLKCIFIGEQNTKNYYNIETLLLKNVVFYQYRILNIYNLF